MNEESSSSRARFGARPGVRWTGGAVAGEATAARRRLARRVMHDKVRRAMHAESMLSEQASLGGADAARARAALRHRRAAHDVSARLAVIAASKQLNLRLQPSRVLIPVWGGGGRDRGSPGRRPCGAARSRTTARHLPSPAAAAARESRHRAQVPTRKRARAAERLGGCGARSHLAGQAQPYLTIKKPGL